MGRFYRGDIEGKFWFGVQSSNDADHFGFTGVRPYELEYYFDTNGIEDIKEGIDKCIKDLGEYKDKIEDFFKEHDYYSDEDLESAGIPTKMIEFYARLELGNKILKCVEENGVCEFTAEL